MKTIKSTDYKQVIADSFDVLVDPKPRYSAKPVIGLKINPPKGKPFIVPIEFQAAMDLILMISKTLLLEAPQMFLEPPEAEGKKNDLF